MGLDVIWEECSGLLFKYRWWLCGPIIQHPRCVWFIRCMCLSAEMTRITVTAWVHAQQQINRQIGPFAQIIHDQTFSFMQLTCVWAIRTRQTGRRPSVCPLPSLLSCLFSGLVDSICIGIGHGDTMLAVWLSYCFSGQRFEWFQAPPLLITHRLISKTRLD